MPREINCRGVEGQRSPGPGAHSEPPPGSPPQNLDACSGIAFSLPPLGPSRAVFYCLFVARTGMSASLAGVEEESKISLSQVWLSLEDAFGRLTGGASTWGEGSETGRGSLTGEGHRGGL